MDFGCNRVRGFFTLTRRGWDFYYTVVISFVYFLIGVFSLFGLVFNGASPSFKFTFLLYPVIFFVTYICHNYFVYFLVVALYLLGFVFEGIAVLSEIKALFYGAIFLIAYVFYKYGKGSVFFAMFNITIVAPISIVHFFR